MSRKVYVEGSTWGLTVTRIEMALAKVPGMTSCELAAHLDLPSDRVRSVVSRMRKRGVLAVAGYRRLVRAEGRSYKRAVYTLNSRLTTC